MAFTTDVLFQGSTPTDTAKFTTQATLTDKQVAEAFSQNLYNIIQVFQGKDPNNNGNPLTIPNSLDSTLAGTLSTNLTNLLQLAKNGITQTSGQKLTYYLSSNMAKSLSALLDSFSAVGANVNLNTLTVNLNAAQLQKWYTYFHGSNFMTNIINQGIQAVYNDQKGYVPPYYNSATKSWVTPKISSTSLQAMTELYYVKGGDQVFTQKISQMENALSVNKKVLGLLTELTNLHNMVTTTKLPGATAAQQIGTVSNSLNIINNNNNGSNTPATSTQLARWAASEYYSAGNPRYLSSYIATVPIGALKSSPAGRTSTLTNTLKQFFQIRSQLSTLVPQLSAITPKAQLTASDTLYAKVKSVLNNMNTAYARAAGIVGGHATKQDLQALKNIYLPWSLSVGTSNRTTKFPYKFYSTKTIHSYKQPSVFYSMTKLNQTEQKRINDYYYSKNYLGIKVKVSYIHKVTTNDVGFPVQTYYSIKSYQSIQVTYNKTTNSTAYLTSTQQQPVNLLSASLSTNGYSKSTVALYMWLVDGQNNPNAAHPIIGAAGSIAQTITLATTAAQNLNSTQQEDVRNFLLTYEEYYKSAAAILTKITQAIEKMAQNAGR